MNEEELELVRFLYHHRQSPAGPAQAIAYRALLGDEANQRPSPPQEAQALYQCLAITDRLPSATLALQEGPPRTGGPRPPLASRGAQLGGAPAQPPPRNQRHAALSLAHGDQPPTEAHLITHFRPRGSGDH